MFALPVTVYEIITFNLTCIRLHKLALVGPAVCSQYVVHTSAQISASRTSRLFAVRSAYVCTNCASRTSCLFAVRSRTFHCRWTYGGMSLHPAHIHIVSQERCQKSFLLFLIDHTCKLSDQFETMSKLKWKLTLIHGCLSACVAVIRLEGLTVNIQLMRFLASAVTESHSGDGYWRQTIFRSSPLYIN